ncbi:hypothetical protein NEMBOFW57_000675 [Staphylotrichum longicolle]|uniref:Uncharacterized protein n=1 Tax=Staphylotrichum longicolle TaxID=669026 RepID=A0AAD4I047_9PEZI|nr:hypothetical protein NEMBOFW57_000675 [Staphylotrichum longicolle]
MSAKIEALRTKASEKIHGPRDLFLDGESDDLARLLDSRDEKYSKNRLGQSDVDCSRRVGGGFKRYILVDGPGLDPRTEGNGEEKQRLLTVQDLGVVEQKREAFDTEAALPTPGPTWMSCPYGKGWTCGDDWSRHGRKCPKNNCSISDLRRHLSRAADGISMCAGGVATAVILNFNQASGTCPSLEDDHRWPALLLLLRHLPPAFRCPKPPAYIIAIFLYSTAGIFQVMREPRYWTESALLAIVAAVVTGALYGVRPMVDALVLGGFLSLVCCRGIAWSASALQKH